jgi:hypothetical protein
MQLCSHPKVEFSGGKEGNSAKKLCPLCEMIAGMHQPQNFNHSLIMCGPVAWSNYKLWRVNTIGADSASQTEFNIVGSVGRGLSDREFGIVSST